jgi:hypothetical protein
MHYITLLQFKGDHFPVMHYITLLQFKGDHFPVMHYIITIKGWPRSCSALHTIITRNDFYCIRQPVHQKLLFGSQSYYFGIYNYASVVVGYSGFRSRRKYFCFQNSLGVTFDFVNFYSAGVVTHDRRIGFCKLCCAIFISAR